jgi:molybdopterin synthase catalytic subunit
MSGRVVIAGVTEDELDVAGHAAAVRDAAAGATVTFEGVVRDHDDGRSVVALEYSAHPSAAGLVAQVAAQIAERAGVVAVAVTHRYGPLGIGDVALAASVSAAHRQEAFGACSDLVDEIKHRLPVWKRQVFADGADEWVGST